jgi:two-component system, LytTR family, response regulator
VTISADNPRTLSAIIVDDEPLARESLRSMLENGFAATVVAECGNGIEACAAILEHCPDLLFLDIEMPGLDGFATLERLEPEDIPPAVVFVTAFEQYALRAFEARALDYVLKPVAPERLAAAMERSIQRVREARALRDGLDLESDALRSTAAGALSQLIVRDHRGTIVVPVDDLEWIEGATYYVRLHRRGTTDTRHLLLRERMHVLEASLDSRLFFRTHRSAIVRVDCIREIVAPSSYEAQVVLASGAKAPLSRDRRGRLEAQLRAARENI